MTLKVKRLFPEDLPLLEECAELERLFLPEEAWSVESFRSESAKENGYVLAVFDEDKTKTKNIIGCLTASKILDEGELTTIVVAEQYRNKGAGRQLLQALLKMTGKISLFLEVRESSSAREFYRKNGFTEIGKRKNFYRNPEEDAILMKL